MNERNDGRPDWREYFMSIAEMASTRSTCLRRQIGAVIVRDKKILSTGYNGAPKKLRHCLETGCLRQKLNIPSGERHEMCRAIHAEQNAIVQAAVSGTIILGAELYSTERPCSLCAKMIINAGIKRIIYKGDYPDQFSMDILDEAEIELIKFSIDHKQAD